MRSFKKNYKMFLYVLFITLVIFIFKYIYLKNIFYNSLDNLVFDVIEVVGDNQFANLVWYLPFITNIFFVTNKYCEQISLFNPRYKNRYHFALQNIKNCMLYALILNIFILAIQIVLMLIFGKINYTISFAFVKCIIIYVLHNVLLDFIVILLTLLIRKYMYALLTIIVINYIFISVFKIYLKINLMKIVSAFYIIPILFAIIIISLIIIIKYLIMRIDLGGLEDDFRN